MRAALVLSHCREGGVKILTVGCPYWRIRQGNLQEEQMTAVQEVEYEQEQRRSGVKQSRVVECGRFKKRHSSGRYEESGVDGRLPRMSANGVQQFATVKRSNLNNTESQQVLRVRKWRSGGLCSEETRQARLNARRSSYSMAVDNGSSSGAVA
jgi:hypothetical protein